MKDRSVLKIVQLNNHIKPHVSFKEPEIARLTDLHEDIYHRLSRTSSSTNKSFDHSSRSLSEPRRETPPAQPSTSQ